MAEKGRAAKARDAGPERSPKKASLVRRILQTLGSKRRRAKREDPNVYPLY